MTDVGGLGQPRRARGINVERPILDGQRPPPTLAQLVARVSIDGPLNTRELGVVSAVHPDLCRTHTARQRGGQRLDELRRHDDVLGLDDIDAVRERGAEEIRIEKRDDTADTGDAEPDRHVFRPVRHEQTDGVALANTLVERPTGISVRPLGERAIGQTLAIGEERRRLTEFLGEFVDHGRQNAIGILWDRRRQLERAHPRLGSDTIAANHSRACVVAVRTHRANAETITLICGACCLFSTQDAEVST